MYKQYYNKIFSEFSGKEAKENVKSIFSSDRYSDYTSFYRTAKWCKKKMKEIGLSQVEIIDHKADGFTKIGITTPPQAWDAYAGKLEIILPDGKVKVLADYKAKPVSLAMYSAPTKGVLESEIIDIKDVKRPEEMAGKIVLTSDNVQYVAEYAMKNKAIGLLLDTVSQSWIPGRREQEPDAVAWQNACFVPKNKYNGFAFGISVNEGIKLRELLKKSKVKARAFVDTKLYNGKVGTVTGVIPGEKYKEEEVMVVSHLAEVGANDNASGCGVSLETARTLITLIKKGLLPKPRRTIRFVLAYEIFGTLSFISSRKDKVSKIIAGINIDMVGEDEKVVSDTVLTVGKSWASNPSYVNDLVLLLMKETLKWKTSRWREKGFETADHDAFIAEPSIGIPTPFLLYVNDRFYHSDLDTPDKVSVVSMKRAGVITATYLYFLASLGLKEAAWLGEQIAEGAKSRILRLLEQVKLKPGDLAKAKKRVDNIIAIEEHGLNSLPKLASGNNWNKWQLREKVLILSLDFRKKIKSSYDDLFKNVKTEEPKAVEGEAAKLQSVIPVKKFIGVPSSWVLGEEDAANFASLEALLPKVWSIELLSWVDGKRTLHEIINLLNPKNEVTPENILKWFKSAEKFGYIDLKKNDRLTKESLLKDIKKLGIKKGDTVLVHSSLASIGTVEGGAATVVSALQESVTSSGLLIMPTLTYECMAFNPKTTPSRVGEITNALRLRKDAFRSVHPTHSLAAIGKGAKKLVSGHTKSTFSKESPYAKYVRAKGKILFIGTSNTCNTTLHAIEDWLDLPYMSTAKVLVEDNKGKSKKVIVTKYPSGCRDFYKKGSKIEKVFESAGIIKKGKIGQADTLLMNAREVVTATIKEVESGNMDILLCDKPDCKFCQKGKKDLLVYKNKILRNIAVIRKESLSN